MKSAVDLTMPLKNAMAVYPGDPEVEITEHFSFAQKGCRVSSLCMGTHSGTHVDMPAHFIENGKTADVFALSHCFGKAFAAGAQIKDGRVMVPTEEVPQCDILLLNTGHEKNMQSSLYFMPPVFSDELAEFIIRRGFLAVGVDMPTVDNDGKIHKQLLANGILIYESLVNLETVTGQSGVFYGFPLRIEQGDGSPVRAVFCTEAI